MKKPSISKSTPNSDVDRNKKNTYTNAQRKLQAIPSDKDLELCLEVEMDDEVRELIKCPEKSPSTLLDVTVIKPKGLDNLYTTEKKTLNAHSVKKLITSMKIDSNEKTDLLNKIFGESKTEEKSKEKEVKESGSKKSCVSSTRRKVFKDNRSITLDHGDIQSVSDRLSKVISVCSQNCKEPKIEKQEKDLKTLPKKVQQVYTTPKTFSNIRSIFQCTKKENCQTNGEFSCKKSDLPCHCQNCAIVGILTDSQKIPFATEKIPELTVKDNHNEKHHYIPCRKKSVTFKQPVNIESRSNPIRDHLEFDNIFKKLNERIKDLEERVKLQEEKAVPKEYFKKIITKLVNHLSKLTQYTIPNEDRKAVKDQPSMKPQTNFKANTRYNSKYVVHHCHLDPARPVKFPAEKEYDPKPGTSTQYEDSSIPAGNKRSYGKNAESKRYCQFSQPQDHNATLNESLWKWGSEVLRPGIDLKNKIVMLMEEALQNFKKNWEKPAQEQKFHEDLQRFLQEISKNLPKPEKSYNKREKSRERRPSRFTPIRESNSDSSTLNWRRSKRSRTPVFSRFLRKNKNLNAPPTKINVAYVNPEVKKWVDSQVSFRIESSKDLKKKYEDESLKLYEKHFLKIIENSKTTDKFKLWQSIWNQALAGGQNKTDCVGVQIPDPRNPQNLVTINYTIGEIENLLTGEGGKEVNGNRRGR